MAELDNLSRYSRFQLTEIMKVKSSKGSTVKEGTLGVAKYSHSSIVFPDGRTPLTVYLYDVTWSGGGKGVYQLGRDFHPTN